MNQRLNTSHTGTGLPLSMWLTYVAFVIYGSLVPLKYQAKTWDQAWEAFQKIPFLQLGVASRADWIANGVLYVPVGFLTAYSLHCLYRNGFKPLLNLIALIFSCGLAVGVEFVQVYFPQRTVSLNDIMAEWIGSVIGIILLVRYLAWFEKLIFSFQKNPELLRKILLESYAVGYILFVLFPYDFFVSWPELTEKLYSNQLGWLFAGNNGKPIQNLLKIIMEIALTIPFAFLVARKKINYKVAIISGLALGSFIEVAQFLTASGISQGISVATRITGMIAGIFIAKNNDLLRSETIKIFIEKYILIFSLSFFIAIFEINGFFTWSWQGLEGAEVQLNKTVFTPFYYHYFTTETRALVSLGVVALAYAPIGLWSWVRGRTPLFSSVVATLLCASVESIKLFLPNAHPDPTNLLIAGVSGWLSVHLLRHLFGETHTAPATPSVSRAPSPWLYVYLVATAVWLLNFPVQHGFVLLVLTLSGALVWRKPEWAMAVVVGMLPVFDLATWSGRFFLDEFDALLVVVLAIAYARTPKLHKSDVTQSRLLHFMFALVLVSFAISAARGLWPLQWPDDNAFSTLTSPFNALRIVKGAVWAGLLFHLYRRQTAAGLAPRKAFSTGMVVGLSITVLYVIWEKIAFSALTSFEDGYRATGPFSATHTGGPYLECFIAAAIPFVLTSMLNKRHWLAQLASSLLFIGATYALMVTFSRGGYLAYLVALAVTMIFIVKNKAQGLLKGFLWIGLASAIAVAIPIYQSDFLKSRLSAADKDFEFRKSQWQDALAIRDSDWLTSLFGMGIGRFSDTNYWRSTLHSKAANYQLLTESGNTFVRLDSGDATAIEQLIYLQYGESYTLKLDIRTDQPKLRLHIPICEKSLLTSVACLGVPVNLETDVNTWQKVEVAFDNTELAASHWFGTRPIKLALSNGTPRTVLDIDNLQVVDREGKNLIKNGTFSDQMDHWFFATASALHAHWRIHSLYVAMLFDQGWFGLVVLCGFLVVVLHRALIKAWRGDIVSSAAVAALGGVLVGGLLDNPIDTPRFITLLLLLAFISA